MPPEVNLPVCRGAPELLLVSGKYNGYMVSGRALLSPANAASLIVVDESGMAGERFYYRDVKDCKTGRGLSTVPFQPVGCYDKDLCGPTRVASGYWFGKDIRLEFFDEPQAVEPHSKDEPELKPDHDCIKFEFVFGTPGRVPVAEVAIQAERFGEVTTIRNDTCSIKDATGRDIYGRW